MSFYRRRLPHWQPRDKALFVTWRFHSSVLSQRLLRLPKITSLIERTFWHGTDVKGWYDLYAYVVMPDHVHLLIDTDRDLARVTKSLKQFTAHRANQVLSRVGKPFWQPESFDHWLRTESDFRATADYIKTNPVRAGLVEKPEDYRWSSAWKGHDVCEPEIY